MAPISTISQSVRYGLYFAASWPEAPFSILHKFCWAIIVGVIHSYLFAYLITHCKSSNLLETIDNMCIFLPFTLMIIKLLVAWTNPSLLRDILSNMEEECEKYTHIDTHKLIPKTAHLSSRLTSTVLGLCVASTFFYMLGVFTSQGVTTQRQLLLKMDLPFDTSKSPIYEVVIALQYVYQASSAYTFGVFIALLLMIVLHVGCQIDIMCRTLMEVPYKNKNQLKFFINRHQEIIIFLEKIEKFFSYMALTQVVSNTLLTCCLGYLIAITLQTDEGDSMLLKCFLFYIAACLEPFIYCFAGEYLSIKELRSADVYYTMYPLYTNPLEYFKKS